ncbi:MDR family MFS transporter [Eubacterium sp. 1001713B170207_170306_E7]|uniref:MDR family MFS transporter n=1 Tax=Eubacterium sp. 1001713B170207_170306_E7 TaxID=2787097 RepID=UPI00189A6776|nr:MDR family MFS transporter [Eubacterium sp. 1001713B170207_170306_E7]
MKNTEKISTTLILIGVMVSILLAALDSTVVSTAMKPIIEDLGGLSYYAWPFTAYMLCSTIATLVCGGVADIYGHKPLFMGGIIAFSLFSMLCGISQDILQLIVFRGLQGIGGGLIAASVFTVVADVFPPQKRGKYMGMVSSMYGLASVIGPLAGGIFADQLGWRWIFYMNLPIGIVAAVLIGIALPSVKCSRNSLDLPGILLLAVGVIPLLLVLSLAGKEIGWFSIPMNLSFLFSVIVLTGFGFYEKKAANPIIPPAFLTNRAISFSFATAFLTQFVMLAAIVYLPYYAQGVVGISATATGITTIPMMLALLIASNLTGRMISKYGKAPKLSIVSFSILLLGTLLLSRIGSGTPYALVVIYMSILGFGIGMSMPIANVNAQNACPPPQIGTVTSSVLFFRNIGGTVGSSLCGAVMNESLANGMANLSSGSLPDQISALIKNPQILINADAVRQIRSGIPASLIDGFNGLLEQGKAVIALSVDYVFMICIAVAALGIVASCFMKEAPLLWKARQ